MEHDLLQDYLSVSDKIGKTANDNVQGILTLGQKKKECERKALAIVQLLLEKSVNVDLFLKSIEYLNPSYYEDISEERALLHLCGYPICRKKISKPKHRYKVVSKSKKVYDLNEYGNYCSVFCFNADNHVKSQIPDSPLWLRDLENVPTFNLLSKSETKHKNGDINIRSKKIEKTPEFNTIRSFAELSLNDVGSDFSVSALEKDSKTTTKKTFKNETKSTLSAVIENVEEESFDENPVLSMPNSMKTMSEKEYIDNSKEINEPQRYENLDSKLKLLNAYRSEETIDEKGKSNVTPGEKTGKVPKIKDLKRITDKIKGKVQKPSIKVIDALPLDLMNGGLKKAVVAKVERENDSLNRRSLVELKFLSKDSMVIANTLQTVFSKWISLETLIFIHGEDKIRETLNENELLEYFEKLKVNQLEIEKQEKYVAICKKLYQQEAFEEKFERLLLKNKLKPLPDYKQLKNEFKEFEIKVRSYLSGKLHETEDTNFGPEKNNNSSEEPVFLPLADRDTQNALRQKILSDTLNKSIVFLLDYIKYDSTDVLTMMKDLIKTFKLDAQNLVFKPIVSNYLGFICLKILSLKNSDLHKELQKKEFEELENSIFEQFSCKKQILIDILGLIEDVDKFMRNCIATETL